MAALFIILGASLVWAEGEDSTDDQTNTASVAQAPVAVSKSGATTNTADPNAFDFGKVKQGEVLKHTFVFKNTEAETIHIKEINTSCACTSTKVDKRILAPGEEAPIEFTFDTRGYSGFKKRQLFVHTDSKKNSLVIFEMQADIQW